MLADNFDKDWCRFKNGDARALEAIYKANIQSLINYGEKINPDLDLVKDTIQDLFIELWRNRQQLSDIVQVKFYLFRALRNKLYRVTSHQSFVSEGEMQLSTENLQAEYVELSIISREEESRIRRDMIQLLRNLPQRQREAIYLRFYHNLPYEAIASMMDMNYQSTLNLVQRALNSLRKNFAGGPFSKS
jgi:RNA polymerase sigma-70 factor (ECF subfamily)